MVSLLTHICTGAELPVHLPKGVSQPSTPEVVIEDKEPAVLVDANTLIVTPVQGQWLIAVGSSDREGTHFVGETDPEKETATTSMKE